MEEVNQHFGRLNHVGGLEFVWIPKLSLNFLISCGLLGFKSAGITQTFFEIKENIPIN